LRQSAIAYEDALSVALHGIQHVGTATASAYDPGSFSRLSPSHLSRRTYIPVALLHHNSHRTSSHFSTALSCHTLSPQFLVRKPPSDVYCRYVTVLQIIDAIAWQAEHIVN
jgi:hypothetical protein